MAQWMTAGATTAAGVLILGAVAGLQRAERRQEIESPAARGEYLVLHVAMCVQCHTPRNARGELDRRRLLQGAPMPVKSPWPEQEWAFEAPSLAGLPGGWSEDQLARFLQTGKDINGRNARPPMPPFRMNRQDALAVAAYLRSLSGGAATRPG